MGHVTLSDKLSGLADYDLDCQTGTLAGTPDWAMVSSVVNLIRQIADRLTTLFQGLLS